MANEERSAVGFVDTVLNVCRSHNFKTVTFFAILDCVSTDHTVERLRAHADRQADLRVIWAPENRCVVDAYLRGYREALAAGCDWILEIDAGDSHHPSDIPQFFARMAEGYDCVFGSRFCPGGSMAGNPIQRTVISRGGTWLTNLLLRTKLWDMTSGFELFSRRALEGVLARGIRSRGPFFQTEIKTYCHGLRVIEVPISYNGASHHVGRAALLDSFANLWRLYRLRLQGQL